jgi:hypothetical protein
MRKEHDFTEGKRGAVLPVPAGKMRVTIRLDEDVLEWFRDQVDQAGGGNYQSLINQALRDFMVAVASLWNRHCAGSSARNSDTQVREETWQDVGFFSQTPQNGAWVAESHGRFAFEH